MFNILTLNKISEAGLSKLDVGKYSCSGMHENPDAVIVRSASMHDMALQKNLLAIARAGAGTNNIPIDKCSKNGILVFNTPGANANAVKELVICGLLLASRRVTKGIEWAKTLKGEGEAVGKLVEKGKSNFAGCEIKGKTLGVIGCGAIGMLVAKAAESLGMKIAAYDPFLSGNVNGIEITGDIDSVYAESDYITLHCPLNANTKGMINTEALSKCKAGVKILNFARGGIVESDSMLKAVACGKVSAYVVDFPSDEMLDVDGVIAIPHLGASSAESEENCAVMAASQLVAYLETGAIINSVNMANVPLEAGEKTTVFCTDSAAEEVKALGKVLGEGSKNGFSYIALEGTLDVSGINGVLKTRVLK